MAMEKVDFFCGTCVEFRGGIGILFSRGDVAVL